MAFFETKEATILLDAMLDAACIVDERGVIVQTNRAWRAFAADNGGEPAGTGEGVNYLRVLASDPSGDMRHVEELLASVLRDEMRQFLYEEYPCHAPDQPRWYMMRASALEGGGALVTHTDITKRKLIERENERLAKLDALTHALNRHGIAERLQIELARARRHCDPICALLIDCDDFKQVNSRFGHSAGDVVLRQLTRQFQHSIRPEDALARIGGDEFLLLLPGATPLQAREVANRLRAQVEATVVLETAGVSVRVTCTFSMAELDSRVEGLDDVIRACDQGMRDGKTAGKNRVGTEATLPWQDPDFPEIYAATQPIVDLQTQKTVGYEFLARSHLPNYPTPKHIFDRALAMNQLQVVDRLCVEAAIERFKKDASGLVGSINVLPSTLLGLEADFWLRSLPSKDDRESIVLELCENEVLGSPAVLASTLQELRALGFRFALDDVGFGRTCLETLIILEPEIIKIDRGFVHGAANDRGQRRTLERIVQVGKSLGATLVAEGIEQEADEALVRELGVQWGQGYRWGKPS
jgi:diguanylate cyclase (GGDEF)-like protein